MNAMTPEEQRWTKIENALNALAEHVGRHDEEMAEIRSSQKVMTLAIAKLAEEQRSSYRELRELHRDTEEKLNALIATVDRIIRDRGSLN
jgi:transcriptional regulatory protein LevR